MDAAVLRAIAKWPDVPNLYGWLSLSRRGEWRIRGDRVGHGGLVEFIARNYGRDPRGAWYFQNGPQRVYVRLAYTPMVYRLGATSPLRLDDHIGRHGIAPRAAWLDDGGSLLLETDLGPGLLDDRVEGVQPLLGLGGISVGELVLELIEDVMHDLRILPADRLGHSCPVPSVANTSA